MHMKKIELLRTRHLRHFHCQRQRVIGRRKQRVMHNVDSMEMKIVLRQIQPNGLRVTEEVDFVTAPGQLRPKGSRQNPAPADQRKTRNSNFERPRFHDNSVEDVPESEMSSRLTNFTSVASDLLR